MERHASVALSLDLYAVFGQVTGYYMSVGLFIRRVVRDHPAQSRVVRVCPLQVMSLRADKPGSRNKPGNIKVQVSTRRQGTARREGGWETFKLAKTPFELAFRMACGDL
jgi:hypothetical protein